MRRLTIAGILFQIFLAVAHPVLAAPYFFVEGSHDLVNGYLYHYSVYLYSGSDRLTAAQTMLTFDNALVRVINFNTNNSRCSFWAPADPSLGYGNLVSPYIYQDNKVVFSCGFSNPGYKSGNGQADLIARLQMTPVASIAGTLRLDFTNTLFRYIGNTIVPGANDGLDLRVYASTEAANPTPTPYPTPTPQPAPDTLTLDDLGLTEVGSGSSQTGTGQTLNLQSLNLNVTQNPLQTSRQDDTIPPAPAMSPRPTSMPLDQVMEDAQKKQEETIGEVLSLQSLKELLLPGRSSADQTVVLVNLISTLAFIAILAILIWRLVVVSRLNAIKYRHLNDMLSGELSALESKMSADIPEENRQEVSQQIEEIKKRLGAK